MQYALILWPYLNSRYEQSIRPMLTKELTRLIERAGLDAQVSEGKFGGLGFLRIESEPLTPRALQLLSSHSHLRLLFEVRPDGAMMPLVSARPPEVGGDLSSIIKYKGKTSELFTRSLISLAALESDFWDAMFTKLTLFDPMCGRGTTLFEALNRGWNAVGCDIDASDVEQGYAFLKRYLEYGRFKHEAKDFSMTVGKASVKRRQIALAKPGEKLGENQLTASFIAADLECAAGAFKSGSFHLIACDLPYGVQHGPGGDRTLDALVARALPALRRVLKVGGAIALSFNAYTLKRRRVVELLEGAGFTACDDESYRNLSHWVEQAVLRDFALAVRRA